MLHSNKGFHTECFVCASCNKGFDDLKFSQANGKYYHKDVIFIYLIYFSNLIYKKKNSV